MDANNHNDDFDPTTNWKLAGGTFTNSISFESSFTTNHESESSVISTAVDHVTKSPLLLLPPILNDEPCEITITFEQEHELRQVYIRSSARVYKVYYTKKRQNDKEYLCTVRCGIAIREEEVLQMSLTESDGSKNRVEAVKDSTEKRVKDNGNGWTNEDDWVEVNNEKDLLLMLQLRKQDFYEASAEINDAEPCISITVRLLWLQDKRCALVDEVYVFADPIDPSESQQEEASGIGNSSSSSLMAMLMPALLHLSRGKDVRKERDREISEKSNNTNSGDKIVNEIQQKTEFSKADHIGVSSPVLVDTLANPVDAATRVSGAEIKPATKACNNVETILDQLVNKVSRIETILVRFEDEMLKPINSIAARLQLVEKKLEQLEKKSFESELVLETKVLNPDSLSSDTDETLDTDELDGLTKNTDDPQLTPCTKIVVPGSSSINNSEDCAVVVPKFVVLESENNPTSRNERISAESEISNKEVGDSLGRGSFEEKPKRSVSINDALASAFAGLLSSHLITDGIYSQALVVTAPEFSDEDDMVIEEKPQTGAKEEFENTDSASESSTSLENEPGVSPCIEDDSHKLINEISEKSNNTNSGDKIVNEIQQKTEFSNADHIGVSSPVLVDTLANPVDAATRVSGAEIKPATKACNNVETILDQLVNKVSRTETILMRFEDEMLKPINSIDARLQLVEKKLEQLEKKSFESELVLETKVLNPDSLGSDTDETLDTDELDGLTKNTDDPRLTSCTKIVVPGSSSINNSEDCAVVVPKLVNERISAESEISNEEVGDSLGRGSFEEKPKRSVSINDALASAVAGLLSSHLITDGKYSQVLVVKAPEFSDEDDMEIEEKPQTGAKEELENTDSASESSTSLENEPGGSPCIEDDSHEMINGVSEKLDDSFGGDEEAETVFSFRSNDLDEETVTSSRKPDCYTEKELEPINPDSVHEIGNPNVTTAKCRGETVMDDVLKAVLGFQPTTSVDFLTPVLDVKFNSENKDTDNKCFFEALVTEESKTLVDCNNEAFDDNLVSVEDEELKGPPTDTLSSLEMDHYETNDMQTTFEC